MKIILLIPVKLILKLIQINKSLLDRVVFYLNIIKDYLGDYECDKLKDCALLQKIKKNQPPASDRFIEYPWMLANINIKDGRLLDIGSTICDNLFNTLPKTIEINGLNLNEIKFKNKEIKFKKGDIRKTDFPDNYFDCITCISTLEHIGVSGRYNSDEDPEGDKKAITEIKRILKPGGTLLLTVPYGIKDVLPINKLYNQERLNNLLNGFSEINKEYKKFNQDWHVWLTTSEENASRTDMIKDKWYAIALIKAKK